MTPTDVLRRSIVALVLSFSAASMAMAAEPTPAGPPPASPTPIEEPVSPVADEDASSVPPPPTASGEPPSDAPPPSPDDEEATPIEPGRALIYLEKAIDLGASTE